jgi:hypothetical protein
MTRLVWPLVHRSLCLAALTALLLFPLRIHAQPLSPSEVPAPLAPWVDWVLDGAELHGCSYLPDGSQRCVWPGELSVQVLPDGATFELRVTLDRRTTVQLPGDARRWPLDVRVSGNAIPVRRNESGHPMVDLSAGAHSITGRLSFTEIPETIAIPPSTGRIFLRALEGVVARPRRDGSTLWLQTIAREAAQEDTLSIEVFRRIDDGMPIRVTTRIALRISGRPREIALGRVLLEGMEPIAASSNAPVRMSEAGDVTVQVQPGSFDIEIIGVVRSQDGPLHAIARAPIWPAEEIWVWSADEILRQVEVSGADRIDPDRTNLPSEWRNLPTYLVPSASGQLALATTRRGNPAPAPNQITLSRELWLDPDGAGLTGADQLGGTVHRRWRLELMEGQLGRAIVNGSPHLVSMLASEGQEPRAGVELRHTNIDVRAEWRNEEASTRFRAVGWDEDVQSLSATLHLAPGFRLMGASGVDQASTWLEDWNLWGLFFVLVLSLALGRLAGPGIGAIALAILVLSYHEPDAPFLTWIALALSLALARALPSGRAREIARGAYRIVFAVLCLLVVYFSVHELRRGFLPYADSNQSGFDFYDAMEVTSQAVSAPAAAPALEEWDRSRDAEGGGGGLRRDGGRIGSWSANLSSYEPNAVLQTGPGVANWHTRGGQTVYLGWDGPVTQDTEVRLWVLTPIENAALKLVEVLLFGVFLLGLYRQRPTGRAQASSIATSLAVFALGLSFMPSVVHAQSRVSEIPSNELLGVLRTRLTRPPQCLPNCVEIADMRVALDSARMTIDLDVQANAQIAVPLPGPLEAWAPESILVDGASTSAAARMDDGYLYVRVSPGTHRVRLESALPSTDAFTLSFAVPPRHASIAAPGWEVDGLRGGDQVGGSIQLRRAVRTETALGEGDIGGASIRVTPWLELERSFELGVRWEMTTTVRRVSAVGAPIVARIPLLEGESVLTSDVTIENGAAVVALGGQESERTWSSVLTPRDEVVLQASSSDRRSELWRFSCGTVWRCETSELDPVTIEEAGMWQPRFRPFPGDALHLRVSRLPAAEGQSTTVDGARLTLRPGERLTIATLSMDVRSSVGASQTITLPEGAVLQSLTVAGESRSVEQRDRDVRVTIAPGSTNVELTWQEPRSLDMVYTSSPVRLSGGAVNATLVIERPSRWMLWLSGPAWGPRVLFWPYLAIILCVALVLARAIGGGLRAYDWAFLALGLSQLPWQASWIFPSWVLLIEWRKRKVDLTHRLFNLRQLVIVGWTLVSAVVLYTVIHVGLLIDPDTSIAPSGYRLEWYLDRVDGPDAVLPQATMISVPTWVYHVVMLLWSLWLAARLIAWSRWAFDAFGSGGMWRKSPPKEKLEERTETVPSTQPEEPVASDESTSAEREEPQ